MLEYKDFIMHSNALFSSFYTNMFQEMWLDWILQAIEVRQRIFSEEFQVGNDAISKHEIEKLVEIAN